MSLWPKKKSPTLVWRLSMSSTKKVRFDLPRAVAAVAVMAVAAVAVMAVAAVAVMAVAAVAVTVAAVKPVLVATAAVVMVVVAVVVVPVVAVAVVAVAAVVAVSYGLAQSASNKELLTAQYRRPGWSPRRGGDIGQTCPKIARYGQMLSASERNNVSPGRRGQAQEVRAVEFRLRHSG